MQCSRNRQWSYWPGYRVAIAAVGAAECVASFVKFHMLRPVPGVVRSCFLRGTRTSIAGEVTE